MVQTISSNVNDNIPNVAPNDIYLDERGNIAMAYNQEAILQECSQVARVVLGELVFNTDLGIPFFNVVFNGVPNVAQYTSSLRASFLSVNGVNEVVSIVIGQSTNATPYQLTYTAIIKTIYGTGVING